MTTEPQGLQFWEADLHEGLDAGVGELVLAQVQGHKVIPFAGREEHQRGVSQLVGS